MKRQKQSAKKRLRNKSYKSAINTSMKKIFSALEEKDTTEAALNFQLTVAKLDSAVNKGILHRNTASRKISKLTRKYHASVS